MRRTSRLRTLLGADDVTILMEAHSGLSAKLVEEAGFEVIWAGGLAIASMLGVRDCNEVSWTQILDTVEFMADATELPILVDGDTGHGNFNNVRRLVRKLEQRGGAGLCLEDKVYPKANSFVSSANHHLADMAEMCGKLRAAKDHQLDPDFVVVARTEALVEGRGMEEALDRAMAYAASGADAVLVHSRRSDASEVAAFADCWPGAVPLVVAPTTYRSVSLDWLASVGIRNVVFANQSIRAVVRSLQEMLRVLYSSRRLTTVDEHIVPLDEIFRLQDIAELQAAEWRYLPCGNGTGPASRLSER